MLFSICYGGNSCVAAVAYLACEDVVLVALVLFFIVVSLVGLSFGGCRLWYLHLYNKIVLDFGVLLSCFYVLYVT
jgi:hypothetical protein